MLKLFKDLKLGSRGSYLMEEAFHEFIRTKCAVLPKSVAKAWFEEIKLPDYPLRYNKEWMVVGDHPFGWYAIYNHDGTYYLYNLSELKP